MPEEPTKLGYKSCRFFFFSGLNYGVLYILETNDDRHSEINDQFLNYHVHNEVIKSVDGVQLPFKRSQRLRGCSSRIGDIIKETKNLE